MREDSKKVATNTDSSSAPLSVPSQIWLITTIMSQASWIQAKLVEKQQ